MTTNKIAIAASIAAIVFAVALPSSSHAQAAAAYPPGPSTAATSGAINALPPKVFYACYIPNSGVTYRIKEVDTKQTCSGDHVMFSWTDGGTPGPQGPKGDPGPQGVSGPQGDPGASGFTQTQWVFGSEVTIAAGNSGSAFASCPAGWVVTGGGYVVSSFNGLILPVVTASRPAGLTIWTAAMSHIAPGASGDAKFSAHAICAK